MIECTNPVCGEWIKVPQGSKQVICSKCNTWHFPSEADFDEAESNSIENSYDLPPYEVQQPLVLPEDDMPIAPISYQEDLNSRVEEQKIETPEIGSLDEKANIGYLVTMSGEHLGLKEGQNVVGRKNTDLIINDKKVSRRHCVIEVNSNNNGGWEFLIYDIGHLEGSPSTNGVFVSGRSQRLQDYERIPIRNGSSILIGNVRLNLKCD